MNKFYILLRKQIAIRIVLMFIILTLAGCQGCAAFRVKYNTLTPDEKARVNIEAVQDQLGIWFDAGKVFVDANPKYLPEWKTKVIPTFDLVNGTIKTYIIYKKDPSSTFTEVLPMMSKVIATLSSWGVKVK
jgi:hypothetical protein